MKKLLQPRRSTIILSIISTCFLVFTKCINEENDKIQEKKNDTLQDKNAIEEAKKISFAEFAGSSACVNCHKDITQKHGHTAHYRTSQPATEKNIKGSFKANKNIYAYNPSLLVAMEKRDSGLFQVVYYKEEEKMDLRFDMTIGSGAKGQSFARWKNNWLFQLPITYFTAADRWANSPGFPNKILADRPITVRCLECHSTFTEQLSSTGKEADEFDRNRIMYGVDCEKCHGPAAKHVQFQTQNPNETTGKFIINPAKLSRQRNLDLCALCHGGRIQKRKPSFSFTAGDDLSEYFVVDSLSDAAAKTGNFDVHGNQYGLLRASKCFRMSGTLTCNSCHRPHQNERGKVALFSQRCMECHNTEHQSFCKMDPGKVPGLEQNCIDCHMPAQPSRAIALFLPGKDIPVASLIRSHFITVYRTETEKFLEDKRKKNKKG